MPSPIHGLPINAISFFLTQGIDTTGHDPLMVQLQVRANTKFKGKTIHAILDPHISLHIPDLDIKPGML